MSFNYSFNKQLKSALILSVVLATTPVFSNSNLSPEDEEKAKTDPLVHKNMKEVMVSASKVAEENTMKIARGVTIITREDIDKCNCTEVAQLLAQTPSVSVIGANQNPGEIQSLFMRGTNPEHTLIMIDGVRITDPSSVSNAVNLTEIPTNNIERIEIIRGASSSLYGSSAIGGVINIITVGPSSSKGMDITAGVRYGKIQKGASESSIQAKVTHTFNDNGLYTSFGVSGTQTIGLNSAQDTTTRPRYNPVDKDNFSKTDGFVKLGIKNETWDAFVGYKHVIQSAQIDDGAYRDDDNSKVDFNRALLNYQIKRTIGENFSVGFFGGASRMRRIALDDSSLVSPGVTDHTFSQNSYEGTALNNELNVTYKDEHISAVLGGALYHETANQENILKISNYKIDRTTLSDQKTLVTSRVFLNGTINSGLLSDSFDWVNLTAGISFNTNNTGNIITYQVSPSIRVIDRENFKGYLYGNVATGFNNPSLYRLYNTNTNASSGISRGNSDLKAEESLTMEFGVKGRINKNINFTAVVFNNRINNLISYVYLWKNTKAIDALTFADAAGDTYINLNSQVNTGLELTGDVTIQKRLKISGNITFLDALTSYGSTSTILDNKYHIQDYNSGLFLSATDGKSIKGNLTRRANTAFLNTTYLLYPDLRVGFNIRYLGNRNDVFYDSSKGPYGALSTKNVKNYVLGDVSLAYTLKEKYTVALDIKNVFMTKYFEINGYNTRGIGVYLKLGVSLSALKFRDL